MILYSVREWSSRYENKESRKLKTLRFVLVPNQHDGLKFRRLMALPNGPQIFAAWVLILEVASKMEVRGILATGDGPLGASDLSLMTGMDSSIFEDAIQVLSSKQFGWIVSEEYPAISPEAGRLGGNDPGDLPKKPLRIEGNGREQNRTEQNVRPPRRGADVDEQWLSFVSTWADCGFLSCSSVDWADAEKFAWAVLDFEQRLAAVRGLTMRKGTDDPALRSLPSNYLKKRIWERDIPIARSHGRKDLAQMISNVVARMEE